MRSDDIIFTYDITKCPFCGGKINASRSGSDNNDGTWGLTVQLYCEDCKAESDRKEFDKIGWDTVINLKSFDWMWKKNGYDNCGRDKDNCKVRCLSCGAWKRCKDCKYYQVDCTVYARPQ